MSIFRRLRLPTYVCAVALLFFACDEDGDTVLKVSPSVCAFDAGGGQQILAVGSDAESWSAVIADDHEGRFSIEMNGDFLTVSALPNRTETSFTTTVNVTSGNVTMPVRVIQQSYVPSEGLSLYPDAETHIFYFEGGVFRTVVTSEGEWSAISDKEWCVVKMDKVSNVLTISAEKNPEDLVRIATVTVFGGPKDDRIEKRITFRQTDKEEDPYYMLTGEWELYCDKWVQGTGDTLPEGTHTSCILRPGVYNETYIMEDLFIEDSSITIPYSRFERKITIPTGGSWNVGSNDFYVFFCLMVKHTSEGMYLDYKNGGVIGAISDDMSSIELSGFEPDFGFGIVGLNKLFQTVDVLSQVAYATGGSMVFRKKDY